MEIGPVIFFIFGQFFQLNGLELNLFGLFLVRIIDLQNLLYSLQEKIVRVGVLKVDRLLAFLGSCGFGFFWFLRLFSAF